ncbi:MAG: radical SAM protein [Candidatus Pacebacteria bacterium]|nr:radical SAM protein [Candidatus Paceibacterota bacterium]
MEIFNRTKSFCPVCKRIVETDIAERSGSVFMEKKCPEHGNFEIKIAKHAWYYRGLHDYYDKLYNDNNKKIGQPKIFVLTVNSKCNVQCPICSTAGVGRKNDVSLNVIKNQLKKIKNKGIIVQLMGGEPTLREDLPEIINLISKSGNLASINTNGIRIAQDINYLDVLKSKGIRNVITWIDTVKNPKIYRKMRGKDFIDLKQSLFRNLEKLDIVTRVIHVIVGGLNEREIGDCLNFLRKKEFVSLYWVRGYNYLGRCGFSPKQEFLSDELAESAAKNSKDLFSLEDLFIWQKIYITISALKGRKDWCYRVPWILVPRNNEKSLRETFAFKDFPRVFEEFEKIWLKDRRKAKNYFFSKYLSLLLKNHPLTKFFKKADASKFGIQNFTSKHYMQVAINNCANVLNYDFKMIKQQCINYSLDPGSEKNISRCYALNKFYSPKFRKK